MKTYILIGIGILLLIGVLLFTANQREQQRAASAAATRAHEEQLIAPGKTVQAELDKIGAAAEATHVYETLWAEIHATATPAR